MCFLFRPEPHCIRELNPSSGETIRNFEEEHANSAFCAVHYDPVKKWLFGSCEWEVEENGGRESRTKVVVWSVKTGELLHVIYLGKTDLSTNQQLDFDPTTNTLVTAATKVRLWDLSGRCITTLSDSEKYNPRIRWDRANSTIVIFDAHGSHRVAFSILRYSPEAVAAAAAAKKAGKAKPESKDDKKKEA